jgi:hypothetical protein
VGNSRRWHPQIRLLIVQFAIRFSPEVLNGEHTGYFVKIVLLICYKTYPPFTILTISRHKFDARSLLTGSWVGWFYLHLPELGEQDEQETTGETIA